MALNQLEKCFVSLDNRNVNLLFPALIFQVVIRINESQPLRLDVLGHVRFGTAPLYWRSVPTNTAAER